MFICVISWKELAAEGIGIRIGISGEELIVKLVVWLEIGINCYIYLYTSVLDEE